MFLGLTETKKCDIVGEFERSTLPLEFGINEINRFVLKLGLIMKFMKILEASS